MSWHMTPGGGVELPTWLLRLPAVTCIDKRSRVAINGPICQKKKVDDGRLLTTNKSLFSVFGQHSTMVKSYL